MSGSSQVEELSRIARCVVEGSTVSPDLLREYDADGDNKLGLADLVAFVRSEGHSAPADLPRVSSTARAVRAGQPLRLTTKGPLEQDVVVVASTRHWRSELPARHVEAHEVEVRVPPEAITGAEPVQLWLSRGGLAAGPAVVRVFPGPLVHRASWVDRGDAPPLLRVEGEGFGTDPALVLVDLDGQELRAENVTDEQVEIEADPDSQLAGWVTVRVDEHASDPILIDSFARTSPPPA